ncbi:hypothetical protein D0T87_24375, partial [Bacteroides sp. 51]|nr:hypothetical protein [Bacteroides sp. 51]
MKAEHRGAVWPVDLKTPCRWIENRAKIIFEEQEHEYCRQHKRNIVQNLLREELGFKGLIFTDALAMKGVA